jgi:hypothetical protein
VLAVAKGASCQCSLAGLKSLFVFGNGLDVFSDVLGQMFQKSLRPFGNYRARLQGKLFLYASCAVFRESSTAA